MEAFPGMGNDLSKGIEFRQRLFTCDWGCPFNWRCHRRKGRTLAFSQTGKTLTVHFRNRNLTQVLDEVCKSLGRGKLIEKKYFKNKLIVKKCRSR